MTAPMKRMFLIIIVFILSTSTFAGNFGYSGSNGQNGYDGYNGADGNDVVIRNQSSFQEYIVSGANGTYGEDGYPGEDASSCYQPRGRSNDYGASGGNGGHGGDGGRGGDGGSVTVFYKSVAELQNIYLENHGGLGKSGGSGSYGGNGCACSSYSWRHRICKDVKRCTEKRSCKQVKVCEIKPGGTRADGSERPSRKVCRNVEKCKPVKICKVVKECHKKTYSCSNGSNGSNGSRGSSGRDGYTGNITLIKDIDVLPEQNPSGSYSLNSLSVSPILLSKRIWEKKTNAKSLFAEGSIVPSQYTEYVELAQKQFGIKWEESRSISEFGKLNVDLSFDGNEIEYKLVGDIIVNSYLVQDQGIDTLVITKAYKKSEVTNLKYIKTRGYGKNLKIIIEDKEALSLIVNTEIDISLKYRKVIGWGTSFSGAIPKENISISKNRIEISLGNLGIKSKYIKRKRRIKFTMQIKRSLFGQAEYVNVKQEKMKL